ncbi:MAG: ATP-binding protein [Spirochaetes bacterium]|nr:ATP-binding protein [Spirochaetota bacterium]
MKKISILFLTLFFPCLIFPQVESDDSVQNDYFISSLIDFSGTAESMQVGNYCYFLEDAENHLTAENVTDDIFGKREYDWRKSDHKNLNFGFTKSAYWIYFQVRPGQNFINQMAIEVGYPLLDYTEFYLIKHGSIIKEMLSGDMRPFSSRKLFYRNFVFKIESTDHVIHCLMKFRSNGSMTLPVVLWNADSLHSKVTKEYFWLGMYYGLLLIIFVFNLLLYISIKDINYIYYILWVSSYGLYQFSINGLGTQFIWTDNRVLTGIVIPFSIFFGITWAYQFGRSFLNTKATFPLIDKILKILTAVMTAGAVLSLFVPYRIIIRAAVFSVVIFSLNMFFISLMSLLKGNRIARFYFLAWVFLLFGVSVYALKASGFLPENIFTSWAQQIGSAIEMTMLSFALTDRINQMNREKKEIIEAGNIELKRHNEELNSAYEKISFSEERYRMLIEGTDDVIFTLNEKYEITSINSAVNKLFRVKPEDILNKSIIDYVYDEVDENLPLTKDYVREKINQLIENRESVTFKSNFISPIKSEPQELNITLEYVNISGKNEILGRAVSVKGDSLLKYLVSESQVLTIDNYLMAVEDISYRITRNLLKYVDFRQLNMIRTAIKEILINAIEHGNLNISFEEKTTALENDKYFDLLSERRQIENLSGRKVYVKYVISSKKIVYIIKDEGDGFDHEKMYSEANVIANEQFLSHGRGLILTQHAFDKIKFNKKGNIVKLVKYL